MSLSTRLGLSVWACGCLSISDVPVWAYRVYIGLYFVDVFSVLYDGLEMLQVALNLQDTVGSTPAKVGMPVAQAGLKLTI